MRTRGRSAREGLPSSGSDTFLMPNAAPLQVTCHRRVRPRSQGTSSGCTSRGAAAAVVLCSVLGDSLYVGASASAFLSATAGSNTGAIQAAVSAASCRCVPKPFPNNQHFSSSSLCSSITGDISGSSTSSSGADSPIRTSTALRGPEGAYQQRLRRRPSRRSVSMRLSLDDDNSRAAPASSQDSPSSAISQQRAAAAFEPTATATSTTSSAASTASTARGASSRLDFLRQTSAAAAVVTTSGLLFRSRPASAADLLNPKAEVAAAVSAAPAPARSMVWLDEDSGTVSSRLSQADETFGQGFVAYLARFLLNYDEGCREYFRGKLERVVPKRDGSHVWEEFRVRPQAFGFQA